MKTQHLEDSYPRLISYMEESGYSRIYINRFKREINRILSLAPRQNWSSYMDIYLDTPNHPILWIIYETKGQL